MTTNKEVDDTTFKFSWLPIYFSVQANPIYTVKGVFFKGNVGYIALFDDNDFFSNYFSPAMRADGAKCTETRAGVLYFAIGAGYEFPSGLILDKHIVVTVL